MPRKSSQASISSIIGKKRRGPSILKGAVNPLTIDLKKLGSARSRKALKAVYQNPISMYLVGGLGALLLGRFVFRYYKNHPEISDFIRENFDSVEEKLREFRGLGSGADIARH